MSASSWTFLLGGRKSRRESRQEYKFVEEPDDSLKCPICLDVAQDPWQHDRCGKVFCRSCLDELDSDASCPSCRRGKPRYFQDSRGKRDIEALKLICGNINRGCEWEGPLGDLDSHLNKRCQFAPIPCPNECSREDILRKDVEMHLKEECPNRHFTCEYCGREGIYVFITEEHDEICEKKIIPCSNADCNMTLERRKIEAHVANDCEHTVVSCKYKSIGCTVKMKRRVMKDHEEDEKVHFHRALGAIAELKNKSELVTFKVRNFRRMKGVFGDVFESSSFYFDRYKMSFEIAAYGDELSVKSKILNRMSLVSSEFPTVTVTLLNQLADNKHYTRTLPNEDYFDSEDQVCSCEYNFIPLSMLHHDPVANVQYLKSDALYFRVSVEVPNSKPWLTCSHNTR